MNRCLRMMPYLLIIALGYYLLPLVIMDTGTAMIVLLAIIPVICFITSVIFGINNSFSWIFSVAAAALFIPAIFIFYNESAAVYVVAYGLIVLFGNLIGRMFYKTKK